MGLPDPPTMWAIRSDDNGRRTIIARGHDHDDWRDIATVEQGNGSLINLIVDTMNRAARPRV